MLWLGVCACGGLGAVARFVITVSVQRLWTNHSMPIATLLINMLATFCAGIAAAGIAQHLVPSDTYTLFVAGFLGGFSTFSTAINEVVQASRDRHFGVAMLSFISTMVIPLLCVCAGWYVGTMCH